MHYHTIARLQHSHNFSAEQSHDQAEQSTKIVMGLTAITMVAEIIAGSVFGSMALLADGWHMATHVAAFGITVFTFQYARNHATDPRYTFGTGKVSVLGGFASAIALVVVAFMMVLESGERLFQPQAIQFNEAIWVAVIGLVVNLASAWLLQDHHDHGHGHDHHDHSHDHHSQAHHPQDPNLRAAYFHVLADALTSVLAIVALFAGKLLGWVWLDAVMGLVGAGVIIKWGYGLLQDTGEILLDGSADRQIKLDVMTAIDNDADNHVIDLHIWHIGQQHLAASIALVTHHPQPPEHYKALLQHIPALAHVVIEVNQCTEEQCLKSS